MDQFVKALTPRERIIHPLDMPDGEEALRVVERLASLVGMFKVGYQLFFSRRGSWPFIDQLRKVVGDQRIMMDLKFEDIPNTMRGGLASLLSPETDGAEPFAPRFLTVHAGPGVEHLAACVDAAGPRVGIVGVTVLTSIDQESWQRNGCLGTLEEEVHRRAMSTTEAKCAGVVCSSQDLHLLRGDIPTSLLRICPGIRLPGDDVGDQRRHMTPDQAYAEGADYLVIGRSISHPKKGTSAEAAELVCELLAGATRLPPQVGRHPSQEEGA